MRKKVLPILSFMNTIRIGIAKRTKPSPDKIPIIVSGSLTSFLQLSNLAATGRSRVEQTGRSIRLFLQKTSGIESPGRLGSVLILAFNTTPPLMNGIPALKMDEINASNPCSEYMFLDDTACNLASLNLGRFLTSEGQFDIDGFRHGVRLWTIVLEISVLMAGFPSRAIAEKSFSFRTLGLGYANLGSILMKLGIAYDSPQALAWCGSITALMTGEAYATSAEMAKELGPFNAYPRNAESMLRVMRNHQRATHNAQARRI